MRRAKRGGKGRRGGKGGHTRKKYNLTHTHTRTHALSLTHTHAPPVKVESIKHCVDFLALPSLPLSLFYFALSL